MVVLDGPMVETVLWRPMDIDVVVSIMGVVVDTRKVCVELDAAVVAPCGGELLVTGLEGKKYTPAAASASTPMTAMAAIAPASFLYSANARNPQIGALGWLYNYSLDQPFLAVSNF